MKTLLIVDGYNVIYAHPQWKRCDLDLAKEKLINEMINFSANSNFDIVVVFDASKTEELEKTIQITPSVKVIFTGKGVTADSCIERMVHQKVEGRIIYVATSDYHQQKVIFNKGALRKTPPELFREMKEAKKELKVLTSRPKKVFLEERVDEKTRRKLERMRHKH